MMAAAAEPRAISPTNSTYEEDFMRLVSRLKACPSSFTSISSKEQDSSLSPPPIISHNSNNKADSTVQVAHVGKSSPQREPLGQNSNFAEESSLLPNAFSDTPASSAPLKIAKTESFSSPLPIPMKTPSPSSKAAAALYPPLSSSYVKPKPANPLEVDGHNTTVAASLPKPIPFKEPVGGPRDFAVKMEITPPRKPTLRYHEAEDVNDTAFVENWERKIAQGLKLTGEEGFQPDSKTSVEAVHGELKELRKSFSPEDTVLFKVLESGSSSSNKPNPKQYVILALAACLVAIAFAYFSR